MTKGQLRLCESVVVTILVLLPARPIVAQQARPPQDPPVDSRANVTVPAATGTDSKRCLDSTCRQVPLRETLTAISLGTKYARAIFGGFEQGAGLGGGVQMTSADMLPAVEFRATALTSTKLYRRVDLEAFLPNIGGSRNHADVWFSYLHRDTDFFGIGPQSPADLEPFAITQRSYQGSLYRDLATHVQGGVYAQIMNSQSSDDENTPGFLLNTRILSWGGFLAYDTRDNSVGLTRGVNLYGRVASADRLGNRDGLNTHGWVEKEFDVRGYVPLGSPRTSLLLRSRGQLKTPKSNGGQIPFYDLSWLGGRRFLRGYDSYRFRSNNVLLLSTEVQRTVRSMTGVRGVDVFALADTGQVWGDPDNLAFRSRNWHSGVGGGLQYRHSRNLALRVEVSRGHERIRTYWSLSRGF